MNRFQLLGVFAFLCCLHVSVAFAQEEAANVVGSNSQTFVGGFAFQTPTNAAFFSGPAVSPSGWVFFTLGVKGADGAGLGDALFASNGGTTQALLGPEALGAERRVPKTLELLDVPQVRATARDTVLLRATVGGVDGLWEVSPIDGTAELVAEEGANGLTRIGIPNGSRANQFWGDSRGLVYFLAAPDFIPTLFVYDGTSTTLLLAQDSAVPGGEGTVSQIKHVAIDGEGQLIAIAALVVETADGPRAVDAILRYTPGMGVAWESILGSSEPVDGGLAAISSHVHVGTGGHVVFQGSYLIEEDPERGLFNTKEALIRVSPDGQMDILADINNPTVGRISATHVTPSGTALAAVTGFEDNSKGVLRAAPRGGVEPLFKEGDAGFGASDFVTAYAFDSDEEGGVYISGESSSGQVIVRIDGSDQATEVLSDQFTYTVDGEARVAEQLYFDEAGPFVSGDGAVVCSRIDLDNPTDIGVVCVGENPPAGTIEGEIVDHRLRMLVTERSETEQPAVSYEYWVDVDLEASAGFWQADLDVVTDPPFAGEVKVINRLDGMPETTCTATSGRVRCGELIAMDDLSLELRMVFVPTAPTRHDVKLTLRGSNDGAELQLDEVEDTLLALEQGFVPIEDGTRCYYKALASQGAGEAAYLEHSDSSNRDVPQITDAPPLTREDPDPDEAILFITSRDGVSVQAPFDDYWMRLGPVRVEEQEACGFFREDCVAYVSETYELDTTDNTALGTCTLDSAGKATCSSTTASNPAHPSRILILFTLLAVGWRVRRPRHRGVRARG